METKEFEQYERQLKTFSGFITEPQIQYYNSGAIRTTFAISLKKNKEDKPLFLNCVAWSKLAEKIAEYPKGANLTVSGYFKEDENNGKKYISFVVLFAE